jgi:hypothetical protein
MESKAHAVAQTHARVVHERHVHTQLGLPTTVVTVADIGHLLNELERIENALLQLKMRGGGTPVALPSVTRRLEKLLEINKINILNEAERTQLKRHLEDVRLKAPVMHISFSSEPTTEFLEKLMIWIRRELNPNVLLDIGLQPAIGAGCMLRTTNKFFDMSLRQTFLEKRTLLLEQIIPPAEGAPAS